MSLEGEKQFAEMVPKGVYEEAFLQYKLQGINQKEINLPISIRWKPHYLYLKNPDITNNV